MTGGIHGLRRKLSEKPPRRSKDRFVSATSTFADCEKTAQPPHPLHAIMSEARLESRPEFLLHVFSHSAGPCLRFIPSRLVPRATEVRALKK